MREKKINILLINMKKKIINMKRVWRWQKKKKSTWDDEEEQDGQGIRGRWTRQFLHFGAFHQWLKPVKNGTKVIKQNRENLNIIQIFFYNI